MGCQFHKQLETAMNSPNKYSMITYCIALLSPFLMIIDQLHNHVFYYQQTGIYQGEYWRLLTGHFIHCDLNHLFWNMLGLLILGSIIEQHSRKLLIVSITLGITAVNLLLLSPLSTLELYCGFSGVLNTLLVFALYIVWTKNQSHWVSLTIAGYVVKMFIELSTQNTILSNITIPPYPEAHLAGLLMGGLGLILQLSYHAQQSLDNAPISDQERLNLH